MRFAVPVLVALVLSSCQTTPAPSPSIEPVAIAGCENTFRIGNNVFSGSQPHGDIAFSAMADAGIRTIINVDGMRPDITAAERHGLRYIHLPIGYGGIPREKVVALAAAVAQAEGPVYLHCHHGKHRGPAATAAALVADGKLTPGEGVAFLNQAGTSPTYTGLFEAVTSATPPSADELADLPAALPSVAEVSGLVDAMAQLDRHGDALKALAANDWRPTKKHPDLVPEHVAAQVAELFTALTAPRLAAGYPEDYAQQMEHAADGAAALQAALAGRDFERATSLHAALREDCKACHGVYRK